MAGKKKFFPGESGKYPGRGGKKSIIFPGDNCSGHCSNSPKNLFLKNKPIGPAALPPKDRQT